MNFIEVTTGGNDKLILNVSSIKTVYGRGGGSSIYCHADEKGSYIQAMETKEQIEKLIRLAGGTIHRLAD